MARHMSADHEWVPRARGLADCLRARGFRLMVCPTPMIVRRAAATARVGRGCHHTKAARWSNAMRSCVEVCLHGRSTSDGASRARAEMDAGLHVQSRKGGTARPRSMEMDIWISATTIS